MFCICAASSTKNVSTDYRFLLRLSRAPGYASCRQKADEKAEPYFHSTLSSNDVRTEPAIRFNNPSSSFYRRADLFSTKASYLVAWLPRLRWDGFARTCTSD